MDPKCRVCEESFQIDGEKCPKMLMCRNTVCLQCLQRLGEGQSRIQCPVKECPKSHRVPDGNVSNFPTNRHVVNILHCLEKIASLKDDKKQMEKKKFQVKFRMVRKKQRKAYKNTITQMEKEIAETTSLMTDVANIDQRDLREIEQQIDLQNQLQGENSTASGAEMNSSNNFQLDSKDRREHPMKFEELQNLVINQNEMLSRKETLILTYTSALLEEDKKKADQLDQRGATMADVEVFLDDLEPLCTRRRCIIL